MLQASKRKDKVKALLAALQKNWKNEYFQQLCVALEAVDPRLTDELVVELEGESGKQVISEAIDLENGRIMFKECGNERRLSELEKKRLHSLLNRKSQCTRDIWEKQYKRLCSKLEAATFHSNTIDSEATRLSSDIGSFIEANAAGSFNNRAVLSTVRCTGDVFRDLPALQHLEVQLSCLTQLSGQSSLERDNIGDEKENVIKRIGADDKQPNSAKGRPIGFTRPIGNIFVFIV